MPQRSTVAAVIPSSVRRPTLAWPNAAARNGHAAAAGGGDRAGDRVRRTPVRRHRPWPYHRGGQDILARDQADRRGPRLLPLWTDQIGGGGHRRDGYADLL